MKKKIEKNNLLQSQMKEATAESNIFEEENAELDESLVMVLKTTLKLRKSVSYLKYREQKSE